MYAAYVGTALVVARFTPREIRIVVAGVFATGTCDVHPRDRPVLPRPASRCGSAGSDCSLARADGARSRTRSSSAAICAWCFRSRSRWPSGRAARGGGRLAAVSSVLYAALLASETRAAWIPFAFVIPVLAWLLRGGDRTPRLLILAGLFAAITAVMMPTQPIPLATRALSSFNTGDTSLRQKIYIWTHMIPLIEERPAVWLGLQ